MPAKNSLVTVPMCPYWSPFPFSSTTRLHQAHMPRKYPANTLEVTGTEMVHRTQDTLYYGSFVWPITESVGIKDWCGIMLAEKDIGAGGWAGSGWYKGLVPHHARREGHRSQGLGWVGLVYNTQTSAGLRIKCWFHVKPPELWYSIRYPRTAN